MSAFQTDSPEATRALASRLAAALEAGAMLALDGDLGAGKTTFVQGLCEALTVEEPVASPTFVLMRVYRGRLTVYHFDAYRIDRVEELEDFGAEDYFWGDGVSVVEWAERVASALPPDRLSIRLSVLDESRRAVDLVATGPRHARMLEEAGLA